MAFAIDVSKMKIDSSFPASQPVFHDFNLWFSELLHEISPDIIVGIARGAIRLLELHDTIRLFEKTRLISDHGLPIYLDNELKNKIVLLFDDSVIYGSTLSRIRHYLIDRGANVFCASYVVDRKNFLGKSRSNPDDRPIPSKHCYIPLLSKHRLWPHEIVKHHDKIVKTLNSMPNNYNLDFPTFILSLSAFSHREIPLFEETIKSTLLFRRISDVSSPSSIKDGVYRYSCLFKNRVVRFFQSIGFCDLKKHSKVRLTYIPSLSQIRITPIIQLNIDNRRLNSCYSFNDSLLNNLFNKLKKPNNKKDFFYKASMFRLITAFISTIFGSFFAEKISCALSEEIHIKSASLHDGGLNYIIGRENFRKLIEILHDKKLSDFWNNKKVYYKDFNKGLQKLGANQDSAHSESDLVEKVIKYWANHHNYMPDKTNLPYEILGKIFLSLRNVTDNLESRLHNPNASRIDVGFSHDDLQYLIENKLKIECGFDNITLALDICVDNGQAVPKVILKNGCWMRSFYSGESEDSQYTFQFKNAIYNAYSELLSGKGVLPLTSFSVHKLCVTLKDIFPDLPISTKYYTFGRFVNYVGKSHTDIISWLSEGNNAPFHVEKNEGNDLLIPNEYYHPIVLPSWSPEYSRNFYDAFQYIASSFVQMPNDAKLFISTCRTHRHTFNAIAFEAHSWVSHQSNKDFMNFLSGFTSDEKGNLSIREYAINSLYWCTRYLRESHTKRRVFYDDFDKLMRKIKQAFYGQGQSAKRFFKFFIEEREGFFDHSLDNEIENRFKWLNPILIQMELLTKYVAKIISIFDEKAAKKLKEKFLKENALSFYVWLYEGNIEYIVHEYNKNIDNPDFPGKAIIKTKLAYIETDKKNLLEEKSFNKFFNGLESCYKELSKLLDIYCPEYKGAENTFPYSPDNLKRVRTDGSIEKDLDNMCLLTLDIIGSTDSKETNELKDFILATFKKFERKGFYFEDKGDDSFIACFNSPALLLDIARALLPEEERIKRLNRKIQGTRKGLYAGNVTIIERPRGYFIIRDQTSPHPHSLPRAFCILDGIDEFFTKNQIDRNLSYIMDHSTATTYKDELQIEIEKERKFYVQSKHYTGNCYIYKL